MSDVANEPSTAPPAAASAAPSTAQILQRLGPGTWLAIVAAALPPIGAVILLPNVEVVGEWVREHGPLGTAIYVVAFGLCTGFAVLPTWVLSIAGGIVFGVLPGGPLAVAGCGLGATIGYGISRAAASAQVLALIDAQPRWRAVRDALVGRSFLRTFGLITLIRLPLNSPFAMTNLVLAGVRAPFIPYILGTIIGIAPRTVGAAYIASQFRDQLIADVAERRKPIWMFIVSIIITIIVVVIISAIASRAVKRVTAASAA